MNYFDRFTPEAREIAKAARRLKTCQDIRRVVSTELTDRATWPRSSTRQISNSLSIETVKGTDISRAVESNTCGAVFSRFVGERAVTTTCEIDECPLRDTLLRVDDTPTSKALSALVSKLNENYRAMDPSSE